jgi:hypothetical protein
MNAKVWQLLRSFIFLQGKDVNGRFLMDFVAFYDKVKQAQI